jgi:hypothetical protein
MGTGTSHTRSNRHDAIRRRHRGATHQEHVAHRRGRRVGKAKDDAEQGGMEYERADQ